MPHRINNHETETVIKSPCVIKEVQSVTEASSYLQARKQGAAFIALRHYTAFPWLGKSTLTIFTTPLKNVKAAASSRKSSSTRA